MESVFKACLILLYMRSSTVLVHCLVPSQCPPDSRVLEDTGCDVCRCCSFRNGSYYVLCDHRNLTRIPTNIPSDVTFLDLRFNPIKHLHKLPLLPRLTSLALAQYDDLQTPLETVDQDPFENLPNLTKLVISINLAENVTNFLSSAVSLKTLNIDCVGAMSIEDFKTLFSGLELEILHSENCDFELAGRQFKTKVPIVIKASSKKRTKEISLPHTDVELSKSSLTLEDCLTMDKVSVNSVTITCDTFYLEIGTNSLEWVDSAETEVNVNIFASQYTKLDLGKHNLTSLALSIVSDVSYQAEEFTNDLIRSVQQTNVQNLTLVFIYPFPLSPQQGFLDDLITREMTDLALTNFKFGQMDKLNFNLTSFTCENCLIYCEYCLARPNLEYLNIADSQSTMKVNLREMISEYGDLTSLTLKVHHLEVTNLKLPYHPKLTELQLANDDIYLANIYEVNISGLINLETLTMNFLRLNDKIQYNDFIISNLSKLKTLDLTGNVFTIIGPVDNIFQGLKSLIELRLSSANFWGSGERLKSLLDPVRRTLQILDLSDNDIEQLPNDLFSNMIELRSIDLVKNRLVTLDGQLFTTNNFLSLILLRNNRLETIDLNSVEIISNLKYLRQVTLEINKLQCSCSNRNLRDWIRKSVETDIRDISHDPNCPKTDKGSGGLNFLTYSLAWIECDYHKEQIAAGSSVLLLLLLCMVLYAIYYYRYDIIFWWVVKRRHKVNRSHDLHPARTFHAFLSYSSTEQDLAHHIFQQLEENDDVRFKIAYDCRDFKPGYTIADNIIRCIDASEKVIFLISRQFLQREWTTFELNFAQMRCFDERKNLIILIFVEKFEPSQLPKKIRVLSRHVNYLEYPDLANSRAVQNFWHRLRIALAQDTEIETNQVEEEDEHFSDIDGGEEYLIRS